MIIRHGLVGAVCVGALALSLETARTADTIPPSMESVGSLNGDGVGVCFSEQIDPLAATNPANYLVLNYGPTNAANPKRPAVTNVTLRPDGQSVLLAFSNVMNERFLQVWATNILDLAGNAITNPYVPGPIGVSGGTIVHLLSADLPQPGVNPFETGSVYTCQSLNGNFDVTAGGTGLESTNDGFHFLFRELTGNFSFKVKVAQLDPVNRWSKAGLMVRESLAPGSRNFNAMVTPVDVPTWDGSGNGANTYMATWREVADGPMTEWPGGGQSPGVQYPNVWLWLSRSGQTFAALRSTNGVDWLQLARATATNPYPTTVFVGLATTSANNCPGFRTFAEYRAFIPSSVTTPVPPKLNSSLEDDGVMVSWLNMVGFNLEVAQLLGTGMFWGPSTNPIIHLNGTNHVWFEPGLLGQQFFRLKRP